MASPLKEGSPWPAAVLLSLPAFLLPLSNPDLFWHLSSGRWILEHKAFPRADFLSFTMEGKPWSDFEWLSQVLFQGAYGLGGMPALWILKGLLLALSARVFLKTIALYGLPELYRAAALVLWSLAALAGADIRPELFSQLLFSALILSLEAQRLGRLTPRPAAFFAVFALWANLHAGFVFGLLALACCAVAAQPGRRHPLWRGLVAAAGGAACTPYGWQPYLVSLQHWRDRSDMALYIREWRPSSLDNAFHWPFWLVLALFVLVLALWRRKAPAGLVLAGGLLGLLGLRHARLAAYFQAAALPLIFLSIKGVPVTPALRRGAAACAVGIAGFLAWTLPALSWAGFFYPRHVPLGAAAFLQTQRPILEGRKLYHEWEWGGYLAWRLPWHKVFWDGRYLFHERLAQAGLASSRGASAWQEWLEKQGLDGALLHNRSDLFPTTRFYKDGSSRQIPRPWYLQYMPRSLWALVYWDDKTLFFLRRGAVSSAWLSAHEYRYFLPRDEAARDDAVRREEIPLKELDAEKRRHQADVTNILPFEGLRFAVFAFILQARSVHE